jgi:ribosome-associated translation inhibitor RaiA
MKGIYLTEQGKQEIETKIEKLVQKAKLQHTDELVNAWSVTQGKINCLKAILSSATILPVETNMSYVKSQDFGDEFTIEYPNGVIIQPKQ